MLDSKTIQRITGGSVLVSAPAASFATDTRQEVTDQWFIALKVLVLTSIAHLGTVLSVWPEYKLKVLADVVLGDCIAQCTQSCFAGQGS